MSKEKKYYLYPLILIMSIIPLIVYQHVYSTGFSQYNWFSENDSQYDFFLYYKAIAVIAVSCVMVCIILHQLSIHKKQIKFTMMFIPLFVYAAFTLLSAVFSKYSYYCFHGSYELFESLWVLLGYVVIAYYAFLMINSVDSVRFVLNGWFAGVGVMCLIGLTQALGFDFYSTTIGKKLITSGDLWQYLDFSFEKGRSYLSLYNPNYVGSYVALVFPVLLIFLLFQKEKKAKLAYLLLLIGTSICLLSSQSRTGILGIGAALLLLAVLCRKQLIKYWKGILGVLAAAIVVVIGFNQINNNVLFDRLATMFTPAEKPVYAISAIETNNDNVTFYYNDETISFQYFMVGDSSMIVTVFDENGTLIESTYDEAEQKYILNDPRFPGFTVTPTTFGIVVFADGCEWSFTNQTDGTYYYVNSSGKTVKLSSSDPQPHIYSVFDYIGSFGGRDIIWSNSIPLLKDTLLLGTGPDTFTLVYPQEYYIYKVYHMAASSIDVKPHNLYLQIGIQSGVVALLAVLVFYGIYFIQSIRIYRKQNLDTYLSQAGVGIFIGTLAYMITGLANDSTVTVAPIFWALMGIGIAINFLLLHPEVIPANQGNKKYSKNKGSNKRNKK